MNVKSEEHPQTIIDIIDQDLDLADSIANWVWLKKGFYNPRNSLNFDSA